MALFDGTLEQRELDGSCRIAQGQRALRRQPGFTLWLAVQPQHPCVPGFRLRTIGDMNVDVVKAVERGCHHRLLKR
ncbi:hypothetical protein D3C81_1886880 [compost metagenome]